MHALKIQLAKQAKCMAKTYGCQGGIYSDGSNSSSTSHVDYTVGQGRNHAKLNTEGTGGTDLYWSPLCLSYKMKGSMVLDNRNGAEWKKETCTLTKGPSNL